MTAPVATSRGAFGRRDLDRLAADVDARRAGETRDPWRWRDRANCRGVDPVLFFPERGESTRDAKAVCQGCTVWWPCLVEALAGGEMFGIWGGLSERERRRLRRESALPRLARRRIA